MGTFESPDDVRDLVESVLSLSMWRRGPDTVQVACDQQGRTELSVFIAGPTRSLELYLPSLARSTLFRPQLQVARTRTGYLRLVRLARGFCPPL